MALFKISKGNESNLPAALTNGYCYYTIDEHNFYVDHPNASGALVRSKLSAEYAEKLRYSNDGAMVEIDPSEIVLKTDLSSAGDSNTPVYFSGGRPVACTSLDLNTTGNAATATKAAQDSAGQPINATYIKGLSVSGKTITYTKGDGNTGTIMTQDTTYSDATASASGLMSSADKSKLDGLAVTAGIDENGVLYFSI